MNRKENNPFNLEKYQQEKYGETQLDYIPDAEYQRRLAETKEAIMSLIIKWEKEETRMGLDQSFVGVLIFGSWAKGNVHSKSDLDIWLLRKADEGDGCEDAFVQELKASGLDNIDCGWANSSVFAFTQGFAYDINKGVVSEGFILVTPYDWVRKEIEKAQSPWGKEQADLWQASLDEYTAHSQQLIDGLIT